MLLLGVSHYIPLNELIEESDSKTHHLDWYNNTSECFYRDFTKWFDTRHVVDTADNVKLHGYKKALSIYYNLKTAIKECYPELKTETNVFPCFSYYNYFQRSSFKLNESIEVEPADNKVAYQILKGVAAIVQPHKIIFASRKAYQSFHVSKTNDPDKSVFDNFQIDNVPHPSCAWWYKKSKAFGGKTGKDKFVSILGASLTRQ